MESLRSVVLNGQYTLFDVRCWAFDVESTLFDVHSFFT
ncbi:hypothetical protein D1AOALGA4SA_12482 [Olavius algarvensis Delta 1 endosymbiont]|nr:hypothetical protein D1AOALGA4SA_12482 [Olavius algarvensis Delta 1 endosymbiont]